MNNVDVLLASIDVVVNKKPSLVFANALENLEKKTFVPFIEFHSIIPVFAEALRINNNTVTKYAGFLEFQQAQAFINLRVAKELHEILAVFESNGIVALPYKGVLFTSEIFDNQTLRSSGDVDLLFKKEDICSVFDFFLKNDFVFESSFTKIITESEEIVKSVLDSNVIEITMVKNGIHFDIHWGLHYDFYPYEIPYVSYFENTRKVMFYGKETVLPSVETMFWMIILHNGGKECWFRLKHLVDLKYFLAKYGDELNWSEIIEKAKAYKLSEVMYAGLYILKDKFKVSFPGIIQKEIDGFDGTKCQEIYAYWAFAKYWNNLFPRIKYEKMFIKLQDKPFSVFSYFYKFLKSYSSPISIIDDRFITFPKQFAFLNALSKVVSYVIRKFRS